MTFKKKVLEMSAREIILAMVRGLEAEHVRINMMTFGRAESDGMGGAICFGCAATNTICEITGKTPKLSKRMLREIQTTGEADFEASRVIANTKNHPFINRFEMAIDALRQGDLDGYNYNANLIGLAHVAKPSGFGRLPKLNNSNYRERLGRYVDLANAQPN